MLVIQKSVMALALVGMLAGCDAADVETGSVKLVVNGGSQARVAGESYTVKVTLTGPSNRGPIDLTPGAGLADPWTRTLDDLPVGLYLATADAVEITSGKQFKSSGNCTVIRNTMALCALTLQQVGGTTTFNDTAPRISAISMSDGAPHYGETLTVSMTAFFLGAGVPSISAFCDGVAEPGSAYGAPQTVTSIPLPDGTTEVTHSLDLTATCRGTTETVVFSATDPKGIKSVVSISFPWSTQGVILSATINHWPDITQIASQDAQVPPGGAVDVTVTASDLDGDPLSYTWSNGCAGTFNDNKVTNPRFIAPSTSGPCTLSVLVDDGRGGKNNGTLTVQVGEPVVQVHSTTVIHATGTNVIGVADSPTVLSGGSIKKVPGTPKAEYYLAPIDLFGRAVAVGDVASMSYWTKKGTLHVADPSDWFIVIYTMPYASTVTGPKGTWYGARIGADAYLSENLTESAGAWNQWASDAGPNSLRFYESTANYFGAYTDPHWTAFVAGNSLAGVPYATQPIKYFSIQTSTNSAPTFDGQVAGFLIVLKDGSTALVNFGP